MVKSYCVKEKKQTECVPGSEQYVKTKNGRTMMKCKCASCGITKAKFVKLQSTGSGIRRGGNVTPKPYCGAKILPKGRTRGTEDQCKNQLRYYGIKAIDPKLLDKWETNLQTNKNIKKIQKSQKAKDKRLKEKIKKLNLN